MLKKNAKVELVKSIPLFSACSRKELAEIAALVDEVDLASGTTLIREGERGRQFFILLEGTVEVRRNGRKLPARAEAGFFGEISLLTDSPTTATVTASSPVRTLVITPQAFRGLLQRSPGIQLKVLSVLAQRLAPETV